MLRNIEEIKIIKDNKNDLIDGTFCYQLFEDKLFDQEKLLELIRSVKYVSHNQLITEEIKSIVHWIVNCVDQCFRSNKDSNDLYNIQNYHCQYESSWNDIWKEAILRALK